MQNQLHTKETPACSVASPSVQTTEATSEILAETPTMHTLAERRAEFQRKRKRYKVRLVRFLFGIFGVIMIPVALISLLLTLFSADARVWPFLIIPGYLIPLLIYMFFSTRRKPLFDADELTRLGGVKAIGDLLAMQREAISFRDTQATMEALTRLLPQLKVSDANLLSRSDRALLHQHLASFTLPIKRNSQTYAFGEAIIQALEQVGDANSISVVRRVAGMTARTPEQKRFKAAAEQCLPALEAHQGQVDATQTLLRASMPQAAAPDTLLRPASFANPADPNQLLRAAPSDEQTPR